MKIEDLQAFILVYQYRNISKAAAKVNLSQPELSRRLRAMEDELNIALMNTTNRRKLVITPAGTRFYHHAIEVVSSYQSALTALANERPSSTKPLVIGTVPIAGQYNIAQIIAAYNNHHPGFQIRLIEDQGDAIVANLTAGKIDAAILRDTQTTSLSALEYQKTTLLTDDLQVILAKDHALAGKPSLSIHDLQNAQIMTLPKGSGVYEPVIQLFNEAHLKPNVYFQSAHIETLTSMLKHSASVTFLFKQSAQPFMTDQLVMKPLVPPVTSRLEFVYPLRAGNQLLLSILHQLMTSDRQKWLGHKSRRQIN